jgi:hypothetical protein
VWILPRAGHSDAGRPKSRHCGSRRFVAEEVGRSGCRGRSAGARRSARLGRDLIERYDSALRARGSSASARRAWKSTRRCASAARRDAASRRRRSQTAAPVRLRGLGDAAQGAAPASSGSRATSTGAGIREAAALFERSRPSAGPRAATTRCCSCAWCSPRTCEAKASDARFVQRLARSAGALRRIPVGSRTPGVGRISPEHPVAYFSPSSACTSRCAPTAAGSASSPATT